VCHSLRPACATVGATRLASELQAFEQQLAGSPDALAHAAKARRLNDELIGLADRLGAALGRV